jgi:very-long-chain enoyl-CoA reductase
MANTFSVKLSNRNPKKPIKGLPASVTLADDATVEDAKIVIARQSGVRDFNRIGLYDTVKKETLKDRKALARDVPGVSTDGLIVKDMGTLRPLPFSIHSCTSLLI